MATTLSLADRLGANSYQTDKTPHLKLSDPGLCQRCRDRPCIRVCPAEVYHWDEDHLRINYENCLELGACRVACHRLGNGALQWDFPPPAKGVIYRFG
jgi:ferredoxin like protein